MTRALPWLLVGVVALAMRGGLADVPGWLAPDAFVPTSGACLSAYQPLSALLDFLCLATLLVLAVRGITRGGDVWSPLAAFFVAAGVIAIALLANAAARTRVEKAAIGAIDAGLNRGVSARDVMRTMAEANLAIAGGDEDYRAKVTAAMSATVSSALFDITGDYRCVFDRYAEGEYGRSFYDLDAPTKYEVHVEFTPDGRVSAATHERYVNAERGAHNRVVTDLLD